MTSVLAPTPEAAAPHMLSDSALELLARFPDTLEELNSGLPTIFGDYFVPAGELTVRNGHILLGSFGRAVTEYMLLNPRTTEVTVGGMDADGNFTLEPQRTFHVNEDLPSFKRSARLISSLLGEDSYARPKDVLCAKREIRRRLERIERGSTDRYGFWGHYLQYLVHEVWAGEGADCLERKAS